MATRAKRKVEEFDVTDFMRRDDSDMKSALSSLLNDPPASDPIADNDGQAAPQEPSTVSEISPESPGAVAEVPFPETKALVNTDAGAAEPLSPSFPRVAPQPRVGRQERTQKRGIPPVERSSFDISFYVRRARAIFRLNTSETTLYETFLKWTHLNGETRCQATNRKICEASGIEEKTVRRNLKSLKERGLIIQVDSYDPVNHKPALFDVYLPALAPTDSDKLL